MVMVVVATMGGPGTLETLLQAGKGLLGPA